MLYFMYFTEKSTDDYFTVTAASPHRKKIQRGPGGSRRNSSQSEPSSEADSVVDSPLSEPLNVDVSCIKTWGRRNTNQHLCPCVYSQLLLNTYLLPLERISIFCFYQSVQCID